MTDLVRFFRLALGLSVLVAPLGHAVSQTPQEPVPLPDTPPESVELDVLGREGGWPPQVEGATNVELIPSRDIPGALTKEDERQVLQAALADSGIRELLGDRFAYIATTMIEPDKGLPREQPATRVTFFSYTNNVAVEARMRGQEVESAEAREGYQPPEGVEEIDLAIALARRDPRIQDTVRGLHGSGLLAFPREGQPGYGHRVIDVTFAENEALGVALHRALVDLTAQEVLSAR